MAGLKTFIKGLSRDDPSEENENTLPGMFAPVKAALSSFDGIRGLNFGKREEERRKREEGLSEDRKFELERESWKESDPNYEWDAERKEWKYVSLAERSKKEWAEEKRASKEKHIKGTYLGKTPVELEGDVIVGKAYPPDMRYKKGSARYGAVVTDPGEYTGRRDQIWISEHTVPGGEKNWFKYVSEDTGKPEHGAGIFWNNGNGSLGEVTFIERLPANHPTHPGKDKVHFFWDKETQEKRNTIKVEFEGDYGDGETLTLTGGPKGWAGKDVMITSRGSKLASGKRSYRIRRLPGDDDDEATSAFTGRKLGRPDYGKKVMRWLTLNTGSTVAEDFVSGGATALTSGTLKTAASVIDVATQGGAEKQVAAIRQQADLHERDNLPLDPDGLAHMVGITAFDVGIDFIFARATGMKSLFLTVPTRTYNEGVNDFLNAYESGKIPKAKLAKYDTDGDGKLSTTELYAASRDAGYANMPNAMVEYLSERYLFNRVLGKTGTGGVLKSRKYRDVVQNLAVAPLAEGATEAAQTAYTNAVASQLMGYDPNRAITEDGMKSFAVGAIIGAPFGVVGVSRNYMANAYLPHDVQDFRDVVARSGLSEERANEVFAEIDKALAQGDKTVKAFLNEAGGDFISATGTMASPDVHKPDALTVDEVKAAVAKQMAQQGANAPEVMVFDDVSQIQNESDRNALDVVLDGDGELAGARSTSGTVYLNANHIYSVDQARRTFTHESIGHHGLEAVLGDKARGFYARVAQEYGPTSDNPEGSTLWQEVRKENPSYSSEVISKEIVAKVSENPELYGKGMVKRFADFFRGFGKDKGVEVKEFTDNEILRGLTLGKRLVETRQAVKSRVDSEAKVVGYVEALRKGIEAAEAAPAPTQEAETRKQMAIAEMKTVLEEAESALDYSKMEEGAQPYFVEPSMEAPEGWVEVRRRKPDGSSVFIRQYEDNETTAAALHVSALNAEVANKQRAGSQTSKDLEFKEPPPAEELPGPHDASDYSPEQTAPYEVAYDQMTGQYDIDQRSPDQTGASYINETFDNQQEADARAAELNKLFRDQVAALRSKEGEAGQRNFIVSYAGEEAGQFARTIRAASPYEAKIKFQESEGTESLDLTIIEEAPTPAQELAELRRRSEEILEERQRLEAEGRFSEANALDSESSQVTRRIMELRAEGAAQLTADIPPAPTQPADPSGLPTPPTGEAARPYYLEYSDDQQNWPGWVIRRDTESGERVFIANATSVGSAQKRVNELNKKIGILPPAPPKPTPTVLKLEKKPKTFVERLKARMMDPSHGRATSDVFKALDANFFAGDKMNAVFEAWQAITEHPSAFSMDHVQGITDLEELTAEMASDDERFKIKVLDSGKVWMEEFGREVEYVTYGIYDDYTGSDFDLKEKAGRVAINSVGMSRGGGGKILYQVVNQWAHNNGFVVVAEGGLTTVNKVRRPINAESSILANRSSAHIKLADGNSERVIDAANWEGGKPSDLTTDWRRDAMRLLLTNAFKAHKAMSGLEKMSYDVDEGVFLNEDGSIATDQDFENVALEAFPDTGFRNMQGFGLTTLKRSVITATVFKEGFTKEAVEKGLAKKGKATTRSILASGKGVEVDNKHAAAIEKGDVKKAQALVDEVAKAAGYKGPYWHGTTGPAFTEFRKGSSGLMYLSEQESESQKYADAPSTDPHHRDLVRELEYYHSYEPGDKESIKRIEQKLKELRAPKQFYINSTKVFDYENNIDHWHKAHRLYNELGGDVDPDSGMEKGQDWMLFDDPATWQGTEQEVGLMKELLAEGYDEIIYKEESGAITHAVANPNQIKSAEAATYDESGNLIPLTSRFDPKSSSILFSGKGVEVDSPTGESKFSVRVVEDSAIHAAVKAGVETEYEVLTNNEAFEEAHKAVWKKNAQGGLDYRPDAAARVLDDSNTMTDAARVAAGIMIMRRHNVMIDVADRAGDVEEQDAHAEQSWTMANHLSEFGRNAGRIVQMYSNYAMLHPYTLVLKAKHVVGRVARRGVEKTKMGEETEEIITALEDARKLAVAQAPQSRSVQGLVEAIDALFAKKGKPLWGRYRRNAVTRIISAIKAAKKSPKRQAAVEQFTNMLIREAKAKLAEDGVAVTPPQTDKEAEARDMDLLADLMNDVDHYAEVWEKVGEELDAADPKTAAVVKKIFGEIHRDPASSKIVTGVVRDTLADMNEALPDLVRAHYEKKDATAEKLQASILLGLSKRGVELTDEQAKNLTRRIDTEYRNILQKFADAEINRILTASGKKGSKRLKKTGVQRIIELANIGALDNEEVYNAVAVGLGLPGYDKGWINKMKKLADKVQKAPEGSPKIEATLDLTNEISNKVGNKLSDILFAIRFSNMLSGFSTQQVNFFSTLENLTFGQAGLAMRLGGPFKIKAMGGLVTSLARGLLTGFREGWKIGFIPGMGTGRGRKGVAITRYRQDPVLERWKPKGLAKALTPGLIFWKSVTRFMSATDALFRYAGAESKAYVLAYEASKSKKLKGQDFWDHVDSVLKLEAPSKAAALKQAEQEGFTGMARARRRDEIIHMSRDIELQTHADEFGALAAFQQVPRGLLGGAAKWLNKIANPPIKPGELPEEGVKLGSWVVRFTIPFIYTLANVGNVMIDYSPFLGHARNMTRRTASKRQWIKKLDDEDLNDQLYRANVGSLSIIALYAMLEDAFDEEDPRISITGNGPLDPELRKKLIASGQLQPNTIMVNILGKKFRIPFLETPMSLGASFLANTIFDRRKYNDMDEAEVMERAAMGALLSFKAWREMSFMKSVQQAVDMLEADDTKEAWDTFEDLMSFGGSSFVTPNIIRQFDKLLNPTKTSINELNSWYQQMVPFARREGYPDVDMFGQNVMSQGGTMADRLWWRVLRPELPKHPAIELMVMKGWSPSSIAKNAKVTRGRLQKRDKETMPVNGLEHYAWSKVAGYELERLLRRHHDKLSDMGPEEYEIAAKELWSEAREIGKLTLAVAKDEELETISRLRFAPPTADTIAPPIILKVSERAELSKDADEGEVARSRVLDTRTTTAKSMINWLRGGKPALKKKKPKVSDW